MTNYIKPVCGGKMTEKDRRDLCAILVSAGYDVRIRRVKFDDGKAAVVCVVYSDGGKDDTVCKA